MLFEILGAIALIVLLWIIPRTVGVCVIWGCLLNPLFLPEGKTIADTALPIFIIISFFASAALDIGSILLYVQAFVDYIKGKR